MSNKTKMYNRLVVVISVLIPLVVAILFTIKIPNVKPLTFLPPIYAFINGITAVCLILALKAIRRGNINLHKKYMKVSMGLSVAFLVMYVAYHMTSEPTHYGGTSTMKMIYLFVLLSHILLSIVVIPLVLFSYVRALAERYDRHKRIAKIAFPVWLYVAVTGVIVYLMISPYYGS